MLIITYNNAWSVRAAMRNTRVSIVLKYVNININILKFVSKYCLNNLYEQFGFDM